MKSAITKLSAGALTLLLPALCGAQILDSKGALAQARASAAGAASVQGTPVAAQQSASKPDEAVELTAANFNAEVRSDNKVFLAVYDPNFPSSESGVSQWPMAEAVLKQLAVKYKGRIRIAKWRHGQAGTSSVLQRYSLRHDAPEVLPTFLLIDGRALRGMWNGLDRTGAAFQRRCEGTIAQNLGVR